MYNNITAVGYVVKDPEVRNTNNGKTIAKIRVGISPSIAKNKCFIDVEFWDKQAEIAKKYLSKGREFLFSGEVATDTWEKDGKEFTKYYIKGKDLQFLNNGNKQGKSSDESSNSLSESASVEHSDDIPF